jgi:hypothetical protein
MLEFCIAVGAKKHMELCRDKRLFCPPAYPESLLVRDNGALIFGDVSLV